MAKIVLLVRDERNRELLAAALGDDHEVIEAGANPDSVFDSAFDLCLLDPFVLREYRTPLAERKDAESPVFLPYLLLLGKQGPDEASGVVWAHVDEVIDIPVERATLRNRIENLLGRRKQSLELERQNERLERFADVISHDLYGPLTSANGRLQLAQEEFDSEHLAAIADAHDRIDELVTDVHALARQGRTLGETETVELSAVAEQSWEAVGSVEGDLVVAEQFRFQADSGRVRQLFENLFRNAIEHGSEDATVRVGALDDESGFYVADDGSGIAQPDRADVFDSGFTTKGENTGLGLTIVKEIAVAHGWEVATTNGRHGGARFEITIGDEH